MEENPYTMKCPVCAEAVEWFDICEKCGYQNSGPGEKEDGPKGPNKVTLREARELYSQGKPIK